MLQNWLPRKLNQIKVNLFFPLLLILGFHVTKPSLGQDVKENKGRPEKENKAGLSSHMWFGGVTCVHTRVTTEQQTWQE